MKIVMVSQNKQLLVLFTHFQIMKQENIKYQKNRKWEVIQMIKVGKKTIINWLKEMPSREYGDIN